MKVILAYIPVPHRGYKELFLRHPDAECICLLGGDLLNEFDHLRKNLPALSPNEVKDAIIAMNWTDRKILVADKYLLITMRDERDTIVMPREDVMISVAEQYLKGCEIIYDNFFLRWDKNRVEQKSEVFPDNVISTVPIDKLIMDSMESLKACSSDFWRQVVAMVIQENRVIKYAYNTPVPDKEFPYFFGDPRFNYSRGVAIELSTAEHAEARLIAKCARDGISTAGCSIYVTTFPCPVCAKFIASAGFAKCYYREGYSMVDAEMILKSADIELILVK